MDFSGTDCVNGTVNICEIHGNSCPNRLIDMKMCGVITGYSYNVCSFANNK